MTDLNSSQTTMVESNHEVILAELERVLSDKRFSGAPQMSAFLRYIVNETLNGHADRIKAFSVGVDALGKPDTFDAQTDPSVRVLALRLRKTLASMYEEGEECHAIIELRVGTYVPNFYKAPSATEAINADDLGQAVSATPSVGITVKQDRAPVVPETSTAKDGDLLPLDGQEKSKERSPTAVNGMMSIAAVAPARRQPSNLKAKVSTMANPWLGRWAVMGGAILLAATWQIVSTTTADAGSDRSTGNQMQLLGSASISTQSDNLTELSTKPAIVKPTIVINSAAIGQSVESRIASILGSQFVNSGAVEVIKAQGSSTSANSAGHYELVINGYHVEEKTFLDAQLVRLSDGQMLFARSMSLGTHDNRFTSDEMDDIKKMADTLTNLEGPVFRDFCDQTSDPSMQSVCKVG